MSVTGARLTGLKTAQSTRRSEGRQGIIGPPSPPSRIGLAQDLTFTHHPASGRVAALALRRRLEVGRAWVQEELVNLARPPGKFSALHHDRGHIAGGTADSSTQVFQLIYLGTTICGQNLRSGFPVKFRNSQTIGKIVLIFGKN